MENWMMYILKLNLLAAVCVLLVLIIGKAAGTGYSARWKCRVWILLSVLLLLPVDLTEYTAALQVEIPKETAAAESKKIENIPAETVSAGAAEDTETRLAEGGRREKKTEGRLDVFQLLAIVWLLIAFVLLLYQAIGGYIAFRRLKRWSAPVGDEFVLIQYDYRCHEMKLKRKPCLLKNKKLPGPLLAGIFKPSLYLPSAEYSMDELDFIFRHELCHYKRRDIWLKILILVVRCVYWFNPALWLMRKEAEKDLEFACDESVMQNRDKESRILYNRLLLRTAGGAPGKLSGVSTGLNDGSGSLERRIHNVMEMKMRKKGYALTLAVILSFMSINLLVGCSLASNDKKAESSHEESKSPEVSVNEKDSKTEKVQRTDEEDLLMQLAEKNEESVTQYGNGYSFQYPRDWYDKILFKTEENRLYGYLRKQYALYADGSSERSGLLFTIESFEEEGEPYGGEARLLGQLSDGKYYYWYQQQGVTYDETSEMISEAADINLKDGVQLIEDTITAAN